MGKQKYLSKERELELGRIIQGSTKFLESNRELEGTGDVQYELTVKNKKKAVEELVRNNMNLVYNQAHKFKARFPFSPEIEDIIQEGMAGLMNAVDKYDPTRNNKFSTVAHYWVFQAINRGVNNTSRLVRLSENRIADYRKVVEIEKELEDTDLKQNEIDDIVCEKLGLTKKILASIRDAAGSHSSLDKKIGTDEGSSKTLIDMVDTELSLMTDNEALHNECVNELYSLIDDLPQINQEIVKAHFDLFETDRITPKDIRAKHKVSASKYRRILTESLNKLKGDLSSRDFVLQDFID